MPHYQQSSFQAARTLHTVAPTARQNSGPQLLHAARATIAFPMNARRRWTKWWPAGGPAKTNCEYRAPEQGLRLIARHRQTTCRHLQVIVLSGDTDADDYWSLTVSSRIFGASG